ncbi:MAG: hypothetical protein JOZ80_10680 [Acidobacteriaceae bacterium]|nr:hypothetical protein [Acidobacteriaceae bacterium]
MPKTVVALFKNPVVVDDVVREIEKLGIPKQEIRTVEDPTRFPVNGVMSFARLEFEAELRHALNEIGATDSDLEDYIRGVRNGGVLVLASGPDQIVEAAAEIMNARGAVDLEQNTGPEPQLPEPDLEDGLPDRETSAQIGRIRGVGSGAHLFVW